MLDVYTNDNTVVCCDNDSKVDLRRALVNGMVQLIRVDEQRHVSGQPLDATSETSTDIMNPITDIAIWSSSLNMAILWR
jgi:hypothetical protein